MTTPQISFKLSGLSRLSKKLKASTKDSVIKKAMYISAVDIAGWVKDKRLTGPRPKYLGVITGRLRSSITAGRTIRRGNTYMTPIGTNVIYARTHELGDNRRGIPARPFLRPGIKERKNQRRILTIIKSLIEKSIKRA